jgi:hypothetical protein
MKRFPFFVLFLVIPLYLFSQNLVVNPGFESWDKNTRPKGWTKAQSCLKDSLTVNTGHYSCRHEGGSNSKYLGQTIPVTSGSCYSLSFSYRTEITDNGNGCRIWCYWKDASGASLSDPATDPVLRPSGYLKSDEWSRYNVSITAPYGAVAFYLEVRTYPKSITRWDDFYFEESIATAKREVSESEPVIYPNPASDVLNIRGIANIREIEIYSYSGETAWSSLFHDEEIIRIPVSQLRAGAYIIRIKTSERVITKRFLRKP